MGFFEYTLTNRTGWKFTYTGAELAEAAKRLHDEAFEKEMAARKLAGELLAQPQVQHDSKVVKDAKAEIETWGRQREECAVLHQEFTRKPEREFNLALGDVVFFGLAPLLTDPKGESVVEGQETEQE